MARSITQGIPLQATVPGSSFGVFKRYQGGARKCEAEGSKMIPLVLKHRCSVRLGQSRGIK